MKQQISLFALALVTSLAFNNCSKVSFQSGESLSKGVDGVTAATSDGQGPVVAPTPTQTQPSADEAVANCHDAAARGLLKSKKTTISFADTKKDSGRTNVCIFASGSANDSNETPDGNLTMKDAYIRSRYEQTSALNLPANAVICDVQMQTDKQSFKYDDVFYMTFNNKILASNFASSIQTLPVSQINASGAKIKVFDYAWAGVRNARFAGVNTKADDYCLGSAEGKSSCSWPLSEKDGQIKFSFDPEVLINVGVTADSGNQRFGFIITGDNDPSLDCYHEALSFDTTVAYYVK